MSAAEKTPIPKKLDEMTADDWRKWYARILADGPEPECTTGDPKFIGILTAPTVADATGLREGPCLELAKELYRRGDTNLPAGLK